MKKIFLLLACCAAAVTGFAQNDLATKAIEEKRENKNFTVIKNNPATPVKNQAATGTCWSFSTTSLVESQALKNNAGEIDLSEMFTVRNIYMEKARNYVLRMGRAQFGEGGLGHDQIRAIASYGAIPEGAYSGLTGAAKLHNHKKLFTDLREYLDKLIATVPIRENWMAAYIDILDAALGKVPAEFNFNGSTYNPKSFAKEVLHFDAGDYVALTSFTHHPFYEPFILETQDNFSNGSYYNLPLNELLQLTKDALAAGYTVMWDADVSNGGFMQNNGVALNIENKAVAKTKEDLLAGTVEEGKADAETRQRLFENLTTQDDHLMHMTGIEKSKNGKDFFIVKNSWGKMGPDGGNINVSEAYFEINTISMIVPKAAISKAMLEKLKIK
jgi:bleomycin hydrolase